MKSRLLTFLLLSVLILTACAPAAAEAIATSQAVQIPLELKAGINGLILFAVMFGLQWVFDKVGLDLRGVGVPLAAAVAEFAILQFQGLIDVVPAQYDLWVAMGLNVMIAVLSGLGIGRVLLNRPRAEALLK